jgi:hypothetical protein
VRRVGTTVPEASVNEDDNPFTTEYEIRASKKSNTASPPVDSIRTHEVYKPQFRTAVPM